MASSDKKKRQGFVYLERQIRDNWVWNKKPFSQGQAWIDMIMMAGYEDKTISFDGGPMQIRCGEFVTSMRKLAERWGWSTKKVSRFLNDLERDQMVSQNRTSRRTTVFIVNYSTFQRLGNTRGNSKETLRKHRGNTEENNEGNIKETKEKKEYKEKDKRISLWDEPGGEEVI